MLLPSLSRAILSTFWLVCRNQLQSRLPRKKLTSYFNNLGGVHLSVMLVEMQDLGLKPVFMIFGGLAGI